MKRSHFLWGLLAVLGLVMFSLRDWLRRGGVMVRRKLVGARTVEDRLDEFGAVVRDRLRPDFERLGVEYPPERMILVGIKDEKRLEVWVGDPPRLLRSYPIQAASGGLGPKLREGDRQVPEGLYRIESLNPNSLFHLALRVSYPNDFDRARGKEDGRDDLGGDIMIHGKASSIGCLAMGDEAAEDLFVLAAETGVGNIEVILTPVDFRIRDLPEDRPEVPTWTGQLYETIRRELGPIGESVS